MVVVVSNGVLSAMIPLQGSDRQAGDVNPVLACVPRARHGFRHGCDLDGEPVRCGGVGRGGQETVEPLLIGLETAAGMASVSGRRVYGGS